MTLPLSRERSLDAFFFRSADRLRAAGCANALGREGLSVVMQCEREALLDHYCEMVLDELRSSYTDVRVEAYFPESTESLMARFNEILARHSVQDALKVGRPDAPLRVWVVHDAGRVAGAEIQLLARLIHNFPGANVRALLLVPQADAESASSSALAAFGRRLLRWDIELPSPAQVDAAIEAARYDDREAPVRQLLRLSGLLPGVAQPLAAQSQSMATLLAQRAAAQTAHGMAATAPEAEPVAVSAASPRRPATRVRDKLMARLKGWRNLLVSLPLLGKAVQPANASRKPAVASKGLARIPEKAQGALVVAGALLAFSTLAMYWLQPEAFGRNKTVARIVPPAVSAPAADAAAPTAAATAPAHPAVSATSGASAVSSRLGSSSTPWWRSRENIASVKAP